MEIIIYIFLGIIFGVLLALLIINTKKSAYSISENDTIQQKYNDLAKEFEAYKATPSMVLKSTTISLDENVYDIKEIEKKFTKQSKQLVYKNAYEKWVTEDDEKLELFFCEGKTVSELSEIFKRNPGSIRSRITKLELKEKYSR